MRQTELAVMQQKYENHDLNVTDVFKKYIVICGKDKDLMIYSYFQQNQAS